MPRLLRALIMAEDRITAEALAAVPHAEGTSAPKRYRCTGCGNLTRFDAVVTRVTKEFWHLALDGSRIDEPTGIEVLNETIGTITCIKCGSSTSVVEADEYGQPKT